MDIHLDFKFSITPEFLLAGRKLVKVLIAGLKFGEFMYTHPWSIVILLKILGE